LVAGRSQGIICAMDDPMVIRGQIAIPLREITLRASRSSGPGGQHANVTASRVEASFDVGASATLTEAQKQRILDRLGPIVTAVAQDERGQARNRELALGRLRGRLAAALAVPRPRRATRASASSIARGRAAKQQRSQRKATRRPPAPEG
jgi:ribosome-associated protein